VKFIRGARRNAQMCFRCCANGANKCGKLPIILVPINHVLLGLIENNDENFIVERDSLEHICIHRGELETLIYLLNDPNRIVYRKGHRSEFFYYELFRGLCSMIANNQYPRDVIDLFINRLKSELVFPQYIRQDFIGVIRSVDQFELDLQTIIFKLCCERDGLRDIQFMASFPFDDKQDLLKKQRYLLDRPQWIIRKMCAWMIRARRRMLISLLNEEIYNDFSNVIIRYL
jgi:hypothetical protein